MTVDLSLADPAVARLATSSSELFMLVVTNREWEHAIGPFAEEECRAALARAGVLPAAAHARIARARNAPPVG